MTFLLRHLLDGDEDVDLEALDVHFHSRFARCFVRMHVVLSGGCSLML